LKEAEHDPMKFEPWPKTFHSSELEVVLLQHIESGPAERTFAACFERTHVEKVSLAGHRSYLEKSCGVRPMVESDSRSQSHDVVGRSLMALAVAARKGDHMKSAASSFCWSRMLLRWLWCLSIGSDVVDLGLCYCRLALDGMMMSYAGLQEEGEQQQLRST
jgi:hypothetical protein